MNWKLEAEKLYKQGRSLTYIGKELGVGRYKVTKHLRSIGITHDAKRKEKFKLAEEYYCNGMGLYNVAKKVGINDVAFSKYLKDKGYNVVQNNQQHTHNEDIFSIIDTEEKAYWLGFLYADGSIIDKGKRHAVEFALKEEDEYHVIAFKEFMGTTAPIKKRIVKLNDQSYISYRIVIHNIKIVNDLINKGCTPNKSLTLTFPDETIVPSHLLHHFMRGYFEGDGTLIIRKDGQMVLEVLGTKDFLLVVREKFNLPNTKFYHHGKAYGTRHSGNRRCKQFLEQIYKDASIYLKRKYEKYYTHLKTISAV